MKKKINLNFHEGTFNPIYIPILKNKNRYIHLFGGAGSGKSIFACQKEIIKSFEPNQRILCVRKVHRTLKNSVFSLIKDQIYNWNIGDFFDFNRSDLTITNLVTNNQFWLSGLDDVEKLKSIQGVTRIWFEEATEGSPEDYRQLDLRLRGVENPQFTFTYNPINKDHWLYDDFHIRNRDNCTILKTTYLDNTFIDEHYKGVLDSLKEQDLNYWKIYCLGEWGTAAKGLIFTKYEIVDEVPPGDWTVYGLDFGYTNDPTALIKITKKGDDLYLDELIYQTGLTVNDLIRELGTCVSRNDEIIADSAEPSTIAEIRRSGYNIQGADKGRDSIRNGLDILRRFNLKPTSRSENIIKEFKNYKWKEHRATGKLLEEPIDSFNHAIDAIRYGTTSKTQNKGRVLSWKVV